MKNTTQICIDEILFVTVPAITIEEPVEEKAVPETKKLQEARMRLLDMLDQCDGCPFRETKGDVRQPECWACNHRLEMENAMQEVEFLTSRVRVSRKKGA